MASEFLFIIPAGWTQLPAETISQLPDSISAIQSWIDSGSVSLLDEALHNAGLIADSEQHVVEARLFNGEILVVRFG